jgi:hypothetical protein
MKSVLSILVIGFTLLPNICIGQPDTVVDIFPFAVGNQWNYRFFHERLDDFGSGWMTVTDTGRADYSIIGRTSDTDSTQWHFLERRFLRRHTFTPWGSSDSTFADSSQFTLTELFTPRHPLLRRSTDTGILWNSVFPFMHDMSDTTRMYRYWPVDSTLTHSFVISYLSTFPGVLYRFKVTRDSGMVSVAAYNADTRPGYEHSDHHLIARIVTSVPTTLGTLLPDNFTLSQNYPNPFNPSTTISFSLPRRESVTLKVYDLLGREVATLVDGREEAGEHTVKWNADGFTSGVYFYRLSAGGGVQTRKLVLVR